MKKTIELTVEQARELLGKDEAMDVLIRANFTEDELKPKVTRWEDLREIDGWFLNNRSEIVEVGGGVTTNHNRNLFATKEQAEGVLAMSQLSQLMKRVNGDWKPDWNDSGAAKYVIDFYCCTISHDMQYTMPQFLAFPTREIRNQFAKDHRDLILEYFKIYQ